MKSLKKILVPFDDNEISLKALEYAAMFASGIGAEITAFHLVDPTSYHTKSDYQKALDSLVDHQLRPKLKQLGKNYPDVNKIGLQTLGLINSVHEHIVKFAEEGNYDFIVLRSHGFPKMMEWEQHLYSTNAYKVVLEAHCPVFTFTQIPKNAQIRKILLPVDGTEGSLYKIPFAEEIARQFNAEIHLVSIKEHLENDRINQLNEIRDQLKNDGVSVHNHFGHNKTLYDEIIEYSLKHHIDLVIVMSRPSNRWQDIWVTPGVKKIMALSEIPVISIRSDRPMNVGL